jgi:hypothetical protein
MWRVPAHFPAENRGREFLFGPSDEGVDGVCISEAPDASFEAGCDAVGYSYFPPLPECCQGTQAGEVK